MDWKKDAQTGVMAALLTALAIGFLIWYFVSTRERYGTATFICQNSGATFTVVLDPHDTANDEYVTAHAGRPVTCKLDGKRDAYLAMKDAETDKWVQMPVPVDLEAESTPE